MSKLTDKIEALIGKQSPEQLMAGDIDRHIATILADVRKLEQELDAECELSSARFTYEQRALAIRQAKREAYEHALSTVEANETQGGAAYSVKAAIDALDTEGE